MEHEHHHHEHLVINPEKLNKAFVVGILLNLSYVIVQIVIGLRINSLSLLSDAGHNFLDVGVLALSLLAFRLSKSKATRKYTYGYRKASIMISLFNAVVLLISIGAIGFEATHRFRHPEPLPGDIIAIIAAIGIAVNGISAFLLFKEQGKDINVKSSFLHMLSDTVVSLGLVVGGLIIQYTDLYWIDPLLSLLICVVIIMATWDLLRDSLRLSLDGVPKDIDLEKIKDAAKNIEGIEDFYHLHVWALSTTTNALTAHVLVSKDLNTQQVCDLKEKLKHQLQHLNIAHSTIEVETGVKRHENEEF